jgi:hypothetical protein
MFFGFKFVGKNMEKLVQIQGKNKKLAKQLGLEI